MGIDLRLGLNLKLGQKLVMTPMLQQAIKLLPLARLELAQLVRSEITDNPVLEELLEEDDEEKLDDEAPKENDVGETKDNPVDQPPAEAAIFFSTTRLL